MVVMVVDGAERAECATLGLVCYVDEAYNLNYKSIATKKHQFTLPSLPKKKKHHTPGRVQATK